MTKTNEELIKEREEAKKQLEHILAQSRPKSFQEGVSTGVSNIVAGAIGAAGIAVLAPTIGLAAGLRQGGLVGAALGTAGGAVIGAVGAAAVVVGGTASGVAQIVRGVAAIPQQVTAPRQGKYWSELESKWVKTDLSVDASNLNHVPDDDKDILGSLQNEIDSSAELKPDGKSGEVKDPYYYNVLEVPTHAEPALIKRQYYLLARTYHPDKNDSPEAAEKFKNIAEAYQVLSDPTLRKKYDTDGKDGLSPDKTDIAGGSGGAGGPLKLDPVLLFAFLFGSDKFYDYIGRLSTSTAASVGDSTKISIDDAKKLQHRRVARIAIKLAKKVQPWIDSTRSSNESTLTEIEVQWRIEADELATASYGYQLVTTIGKAYNLLAVTYQGSADSGQGLPSLSKWAKKHRAELDQRRDASKNQLDGIRAGVDLMKLRTELQTKLEHAKTDEEREQITRQVEEVAADATIRVLWTTAVVDIVSAIQEATQMIFFDTSVDSDTRKYRAKAVRRLGEIWMDTDDVQQHSTTNSNNKTAKQIYEEAAFAAMLETVKRRDEAEHENSA